MSDEKYCGFCEAKEGDDSYDTISHPSFVNFVKSICPVCLAKLIEKEELFNA
jgi:hypothetical protein